MLRLRSGEHLRAADDAVVTSTMQFVSKSDLGSTLVIDGTTLTGDRLVTAVMVSIPVMDGTSSPPIIRLHDLVFPGSRRQTGALIAEDVIAQIDSLGQSRIPGDRASAVVSDSCAAMKLGLAKAVAK